MARAGRETLVYDTHPAIGYQQAVIRNLSATTGRSLAEWTALARSDGPAGETELRAWLKQRHGVGMTSAGLIAHQVVIGNIEDYDPTALADAQYAGPKAGLRPLYEQLVRRARALGPDVRVCPCKTRVPLYRNHVFAEIKPTTRTRVDLGLALGPLPATGRLVLTGGLEKKDRLTHRIPLGSRSEIDPEVERWLTTAYDRDA